jgi:hypothetical protein
MEPQFNSVPVQNPDEIDVERNSNMWNCCLFGSSDRHCLRFIAITSLSFFIVGFNKRTR